MANRIKTIQSLLEKSPSDVFLHYSLAMEFCAASLEAAGDAATLPSPQPVDKTPEELRELAQEHFGICIQLDPNYLPAYVELGKCCRSAGQFQKAREIFNAGLTLAANQGQQHTQDYIRQQIEGLPKT
jgi:tetratricopeptide (TPR) repeat protein